MKIRGGPARSFGYLRRSDLEQPEGPEIWERPDGHLIVHDRANGPLIVVRASGFAVGKTSEPM